MKHRIRPTTRDDVAGLRTVLEETGLFPQEMLTSMLKPALSGEAEAVWVTVNGAKGVEGFAYIIPEALADGTWNMLAIAVRPALQKGGRGRELLEYAERLLRDQGYRLLIVDTSGTDDFTSVRTFYRNAGYTEEARIRDFWADGDDKVTFRKAL